MQERATLTLAGEVASQRRDDVTQHFGWPCVVLRAEYSNALYRS